MRRRFHHADNGAGRQVKVQIPILVGEHIVYAIGVGRTAQACCQRVDRCRGAHTRKPHGSKVNGHATLARGPIHQRATVSTIFSLADSLRVLVAHCLDAAAGNIHCSAISVSTAAYARAAETSACAAVGRNRAAGDGDRAAVSVSAAAYARAAVGLQGCSATSGYDRAASDGDRAAISVFTAAYARAAVTARGPKRAFPVYGQGCAVWQMQARMIIIFAF